ncbi:MAG: hypothetical protein Q8L35_05820, partial [Actinomycetota bacterium]|nr:hypothetical protein [Actinomycetota bacterium]
MKRFDDIFLSIIYLPIFPTLLFLTGWWLRPRNAPLFAFAGLLVGIVLGKLFIKKLIKPGYDQKTIIVAVVYLFYSIGLFGLFMGLPAFNVLPGAVAGVYTARKAVLSNWNKDVMRRNINNVSFYSLGVLFFACIASARLALEDAYTGRNISQMLGLNFTITLQWIWAIII